MRHLLDHPMLYAAWQAPFIAQKVAPFVYHNPGLAFRRVLDVGCGPGTNRSLFANHAYVGVDLDRSYAARSKHRAGGCVVAADAARLPFRPGTLFDCVFVNSLLHHLDDTQVDRLLCDASRLLMPGGTIHVIDLVVPDQHNLARGLALRDRGNFPRSLTVLRAALNKVLVTDVEQQFPLHIGPINFWQMVYVRGTPKEGACASA